MDQAPSMMEYLMSLTPKEAAEAVKALPPSEKLRLVNEVCGAVEHMAAKIVANADEIWESRDGIQDPTH